MSLPYVSPAQMNDYRQKILLFKKSAPSLECIRSHYLPDRTGVCDLTGAKEQEELFVLANRAGSTMKVSAAAMQIVANVVDITGADAWYQSLKEQKKTYKERLTQEMLKKEEERKAASRTVLLRKKTPNTLLKEKNG